MAQCVRAFIAACPACAWGKSPHLPPASLLKLLPIPHCPWSHITVDFILCLPRLGGHIVILKIVDHFSKATHFVPLPKLLSAAETGALLVQHVSTASSQTLCRSGVRRSPLECGVEVFLLHTEGGCEPYIRVPPTFYWPGGESEPYIGEHALVRSSA